MVFQCKDLGFYVVLECFIGKIWDFPVFMVFHARIYYLASLFHFDVNI